MFYPHKKIEAARDRWRECFWHLRQLEAHYHDVDPLRYSMNAFIRALREIPDMVTMSTQNNKEFVVWHKPIREALYEDPLIARIIKHRNYIVHKSMLKLGSKAQMVSICGYTIKKQFSFDVSPFENSDDAFRRFVDMANETPALLDFFALEGEQVLALKREWHIEGFENEIITDFRGALKRMDVYLSDAIEFLGGKRVHSDFSKCFKDPREYWYKKYRVQCLDPE